MTPGKHYALLVDQAGWHLSKHLIVPSTITIVKLLAQHPGLNALENFCQFMCDNWLSNRVFWSYHAIVGNCCQAWDRLADQPWRVVSIGLRTWAQVT